MTLKKWIWPLAALFLAVALFVAFRPEPPKVAQADAPQTLTESPKLVALTFDDGPKSTTTPRLVEGLAQRGVKATFFLIGAQIEDNADLVCQMAQAGHQLGVHTYDHVSLLNLNQADFDAQVQRTRQTLEGLLGPGEYFLRPPYGEVDDGIKRYAGSPIILWSVDPEDWHNRKVQREVAHIVSEVKDGDIILMHDIFPESVDAALQVVDQLHHAGYVFVTVEELFAARGVELKVGEPYRNAPPS